MKSIGVLGAGSWGTALAIHVAGSGSPVRLWARRPELADRLQRDRVNEAYLPGAVFPEALEVTADIEDLVDCEVVLAVVPSHGYREVVERFFEALPAGRPLVLVSATKGIETESLARMSQVTAETAETTGHAVRFATLAGPSFAAELAAGAPTAAVIAAEDGDLAKSLGRRFSTSNLRLYSTTDVVGVELGGTAKNVIAIGAGIVSGLELGHNTLAALLTRGLHEISRLGVACGGQRQTLSGLAGLGDLVLTCTGGLSRNRRTGLELARGKTLEQIQGETQMVAEGIRNSVSLTRLAGSLGIEMPITEQMMAVLYEGKTPRQAVEELMTRALKAESEL